MKTVKMIQKIILLFIMSFPFMACVHDDDYNEPPVNEGQVLTATLDIPYLHNTAPVYTGRNGVEAIPFSDGQILEGYVISSDHAGNIYKNLFIVTDDGKQGIMLSINKSSIYTFYPLGSKIYVKLDGLYYGKQNGMVQIGMMPTQPDRYIVDQITSTVMTSHVILGKDKKNEEDLVIKTDASGNPLTVREVNNNEKYLCTLIQVNDVEFNEAGQTFARGNTTTNNQINSYNVDFITVRVSNYASFAGYIIPEGIGKVRGVMTRYDGTYKTYQLLMRTIDDVKDFAIPEPPVFEETFDNVTDASGNGVSSTVRPKINVAMNFDNGSPVVYSDPTGRADIRLLNSNACVWMPKSTTTDASLIIDNLPTTGKTNLKLQYSFNAGIYNMGETSNANMLIVKFDGVLATVPNIPMDSNNSKNSFITVELPIPDGTTKIEFLATITNNTYGMRLDNIRLIK